MKKLILLPLLLFFGFTTAQDLEGSWKAVSINGEPTDIEGFKIYQDNYFSWGFKNAKTDEFVSAGGGEYSVKNGLSETYDFYTPDPQRVGETRNYEVTLSGDELRLEEEGGDVEVWRRVSDSENDLSGNWVITGRQRNGELSRSTPGARRTIKILGGDRFQWVAFNSDTGEFFGSGGGTYTAEDGKYVEDIEFFSRDDSRVGASLPFEYEVKNGEWHHRGKSSKGEPIYEIWSPYKEAYNQEAPER